MIVSKPTATSSPSLSGQRTQTALLTASTPGEYIVELTVTDAHGAIGQPDRIVFMGAPATNLPPILDPVGPRSVSELQPFAIRLSGSDPDGDPVAFEVGLPLPDGAVFDTADATFTWTPTADQAGTYEIEFRVLDCWRTSAKETVTITVLDTNRIPVLASLGDRTVLEGEMLEIFLSAIDADGSTLTYSAEDVPVGAVFDSAAGRFTWTPSYDQAGEYPVTFGVSDGTDSAEESMIIQVLDRDITRPEITLPDDTKTVPAEGFVVSAIDDSGSATISYVVWLDGQPVGTDTGAGSVEIPAETFASTGTYTVSFRAIDGAGNEATSSFTVSVDATPPEITAFVATPNPLPVDSPVAVTAAVDDTARISSGVASAAVSVDGGDWLPMNPADGAFGTTDERVTVTLPAFPSPGVQGVRVKGADAAGNTAECDEELLLAVYDPAGGFVTAAAGSHRRLARTARPHR